VVLAAGSRQALLCRLSASGKAACDPVLLSEFCSPCPSRAKGLERAAAALQHLH
jgi:hypothetical protein